VVTIADLRSLEVEADVSESNLEGVTVGQRGEIVLDAYPDQRYPGYVAMIVPTADRAKATVQVKVAFRSYDARVLPEMSAKVHFLPAELRAAGRDTQPRLTVPAGAVAERDGRTVVYVVDRGRAREIPVSVGARFGGFVTILQGLAVGALVIDSVGERVRPGAKVKVQ
jgi:HlyD family secretion protein